MSYTVDLFRSAVKLANIAGILPKERTQVLNTAHQIWPLLFLVPVLLSQLVAISRYWGDTMLVLDIVGMMAVILLGIWVNVWCIFQSRQLLKAMEYLEIDSVLTSPLVQQNFALKQIVKKGQKKSYLVSQGIGCSICLAFLFWIISPIVIAYLQSQENQCQQKESNRTLTPREVYQQDGYDQFSFPMWLPLDSTKWYTEIWILQMMCYLGAFRAMFPLSRVIITMFVAAGLQCEVVAELVRHVSNCHDHPEVPAEVKKATEITYLKHIIKLHQDVLTSSKEMDSLQNPLVGISLTFLMVINVTSMFQLTVEPSLALKYALTIAAVLLHIYIYCFFGETIAEQSERIGEAAYGSDWYERSTEFKRMILLLICQCQRPCVWSVLQVIRIKVISFADVTSVCYRVFMLLLRVEETRAATGNTCLQ